MEVMITKVGTSANLFHDLCKHDTKTHMHTYIMQEGRAGEGFIHAMWMRMGENVISN